MISVFKLNGSSSKSFPAFLKECCTVSEKDENMNVFLKKYTKTIFKIGDFAVLEKRYIVKITEIQPVGHISKSSRKGVLASKRLPAVIADCNIYRYVASSVMYEPRKRYASRELEQLFNITSFSGQCSEDRLAFPT